MYPTLVLSAALLTPAAPVPRDTAPNTTGPAPRVLALKADASGAVRIIGNVPTKVTVTNTYVTVEQVVENGQPVQRQVQKQVDQDIITQQYINKSLADFNGKFMTAGGTPLTLEEATSRVKNGATMLASSDGKPIAQAWLKAVHPDTVVMVGDATEKIQIQVGGGMMPSTPTPVLTMLGTDESGKVQVPCTSAPVNPNNGVYYDDIIFEGRGGFGKRGFRGDFGYVDYGYNQQYNGKVVNKPLADVKFDAYDVTGRMMTKGAALKRLAAGGMVLVAGNNQMPDEAYLKAFHQDVIVLVGTELVLPIVPVDQTKKKETAKGDPKDPKAAPAPAVDLPALPVPAIKPGVIIKGRAAGNVVPAPAPAVEKK